jgi:predicted RNA-binding Zn ribbon-like protein
MPQATNTLRILCDTCTGYRLRDQRPGRRCWLSVPNGGNRTTCKAYMRETGSDDVEPPGSDRHNQYTTFGGNHNI